MAIVKNFTDGTLQISDSSGKSITVSFDMGDFSLTNLRDTMKDVAAYESRGAIVSLRHTGPVQGTGSFKAMVTDFSAVGAPTVADAVLRNGDWHDAVSSTDAPDGDVYCVDMTFTQAGHGSADSTVTVKGCHVVMGFEEGDPNSFNFDYTVYGPITGGLATS